MAGVLDQAEKEACFVDLVATAIKDVEQLNFDVIVRLTRWGGKEKLLVEHFLQLV